MYRFEAALWQWQGKGDSWAFVTLPEDVTDEIDDRQVGPRRGFGAVKVQVTVGATTWTTSLFPSKEHAAYILPVKAAVRRAESLSVGAAALFEVELIAP